MSERACVRTAQMKSNTGSDEFQCGIRAHTHHINNTVACNRIRAPTTIYGQSVHAFE